MNIPEASFSLASIGIDDKNIEYIRDGYSITADQGNLSDFVVLHLKAFTQGSKRSSISLFSTISDLHLSLYPESTIPTRVGQRGTIVCTLLHQNSQ